MKLKYYLRGLGIGILVSTIILMISFSGHPRELSDKEIISRAQELGMVMGENKTGDSIPRTTENTGDMGQEVPTGEGDQPQKKPGGNAQPPEGDNRNGNDTASAGGTEPEGTELQETTEDNGGRVTEFTVADGESAFSVCIRLHEEGLVEDAFEFNNYLIEKNYAKYVMPGTIQIPEGADYVKIAELLAGK